VVRSPISVRAAAVAVVLAACAACTVPPLDSGGRPCSPEAPCGPGFVCDPAAGTCVSESADLGPAEAAVDTRLLFPDGPLPDGPLPDQPQPGDQTVDQPPSPDVSLPCQGLTCPLGCNVTAKRCYRLKPTGFDAAPFYDQLTADVVANSAPLTFETDTGEVRVGTTVLRSAGGHGQVKNGIYWDTSTQAGGYPEVGVFGLKSLEVAAGANASVVGDRAFALYVAGDVQIAGTLAAPVNGSVPGAGGLAGGDQNNAAGVPCFGGEGGGGEHLALSSSSDSGGGGGGRIAAGGKGGNSTNAPYAQGGAGGVATGSPTLSPLFGGCGGGAGGAGGSGDAGPGGGGGGAIQIAANGMITVAGVISAPGAGGRGGRYGAGGGGGGSGGAVLLEAHGIAIAGFVAANGGGGGAGSAEQSIPSANHGEDGLPSTQNAAGAAPNSPYGGAGGMGGALSPQTGAQGQTDINGGGGGGAAGRIRLNTKTPPAVSGGVSPTATTSTTVATW
jgi:hypothetical protein